MNDCLLPESFSFIGFWHSLLSWFSFYFTGFLFSFSLLATPPFLHLGTIPCLPSLGYFIHYQDVTLCAHQSQVCVTGLFFSPETQIIFSNSVLKSFISISNWHLNLNMSKIELWLSSSHRTQTWWFRRHLGSWHHCASSCWDPGFRGIFHLPIFPTSASIQQWVSLDTT